MLRRPTKTSPKNENKQITQKRRIKERGEELTEKMVLLRQQYQGEQMNFCCCSNQKFVDRTEHFFVVTKYFCHPYFNK